MSRSITAFILILFLILIPVQTVSADDVQLRIKEVDNNTYSVKFNNQSWEMCNEGNCTIQASDIEPQDVNVDTDDLKMMAEFIAADLPNRTLNVNHNNNVNRSIVRSAIIDVVEEEHQDTQAWLKKTYMPKQDKIRSLSTKLASANQSLKTLDAEIGKYKGEVENKERTIKDLNRQLTIVTVLFVVTFGGFSLMMFDRAGIFSRIKEHRRK